MPNGKGSLDCCYCTYFKCANNLEGYQDAAYETGWCCKNLVTIPESKTAYNRICAQFYPNKSYSNDTRLSFEHRFALFEKQLDPKFLYYFPYNLPHLVKELAEFTKLRDQNLLDSTQ